MILIMKNYLFIFTISISFSQWFSLEHNGANRTYYVSSPESLNPGLIIDMHGYGMTADQEYQYTDMDYYAHQENLMVVYPQGLNNAWNVGTYWDSSSADDIGFISLMIDDIISNFNINPNRIYACGLSNGGYMAYELACELADRITAFGSVTGNFMLNGNQECNNDREIPIIHFHGTNDNVVNYYPPSFDGSLTAEQSIEYWSEYNNLTVETTEFIQGPLGSTTEVQIYSSELSDVQFVHYKVYGGGHEWFGTGFDWGFHSSEKIVEFFLQYQLSDFMGENQQSGDLNNDGIINIQDIILIIELILIGSNEYTESADLNHDGNIDVLDAIEIVNIILN